MKKNILSFIFLVFITEALTAQKKDTINYYPIKTKRITTCRVPYDSIGIQSKFGKGLIVPVILIGYGLTTLHNYGLYSSYQMHKDINKTFPHAKSSIDNYLIYSPYFEFATLLLLKIKNKDDLLNTTILIIKSEILMNIIIWPMKKWTHEERPYSYDNKLNGIPLSERKKDKQAFLSMPSGHTAEAFLAATVVYKEYRCRSQWYGIIAYTLASTVGLYRMINDKHWESDVFVGAGIGILSANMAYVFHQHRWGRHEVVCLPTMIDGTKGIMLSCKF
ncbi:MAG: phosphatase PAP2 family protein [Bacteroidales bacterium]|jgi:hypothetical protein